MSGGMEDNNPWHEATTRLSLGCCNYVKGMEDIDKGAITPLMLDNSLHSPTEKVGYKIENSIFTTLCSKLNRHHNTSSDRKSFRKHSLVGLAGLGQWLVTRATNWTIPPHPTYKITGYSALGSDSLKLSEDGSNTFITNNIDTIRKCLSYFIYLINAKFNVDLSEYTTLMFQIDIRSSRIATHHPHRDGDDLFIIFIYPKHAPTATTIIKWSCNTKAGKPLVDGEGKTIDRTVTTSVINDDDQKTEKINQ